MNLDWSIVNRMSCADEQLKNWHLEGTAKLIFKPLTGTIPGFGAVLVSLTEPVSTRLTFFPSLKSGFLSGACY